MRLHLQTIGDSKNPPIIFLHGLFGQGDDFLLFADKLSDKYYSILVDLPGHGQSDILETNSFTDLCKLILKSLPDLKQKPILAGYSLGGRIALYLSTYFPHLFNRAIIISANPGLELGKEERLKADLSLLEDIQNPETFFLNWYSKPLFGDLINHKDFPLLMEKRKKTNLQNIKKCLGSFSVGSQPSLWDKFQNKSFPLFYFCGQKDEKYNKIGHRLAQYPSINLIELENAGHYLHFEYPTLFCDHFESILK